MVTMKPRGRNAVARRRWMAAGLVAFLAVDIALIVVALTGASPSAQAGATLKPSPTESPVPVVEPVETPSPPVATTPPPVETLPPNRVLAAFDQSTAWRSATGACPGPAVVPEVTKDGGNTWSAADEFTSTGGTWIATISAISTTEASVVTLTKDCAPRLFATFVSGTAWKEYPERLEANWFVNPMNRAQITAPAGVFDAPCPTVIALAARSDAEAATLCSDGKLYRTQDSGATWSPGVATAGGANVAVTTDGYVVGAVNDGCAGVELHATSAEADGALAAVACFEATFNPGEVAMSGTDGILWLWVGETLSRSSDGGISWD